jgi:hypothetical protein
MSATLGTTTARDDARALSCLKGVARIACVISDEDGRCVVTIEIPYHGVALLARCSDHEVDTFLAAIA